MRLKKWGETGGVGRLSNGCCVTVSGSLKSIPPLFNSQLVNHPLSDVLKYYSMQRMDGRMILAQTIKTGYPVHLT
jgi:hypothetical protein